MQEPTQESQEPTQEPQEPTQEPIHEEPFDKSKWLEVARSMKHGAYNGREGLERFVKEITEGTCELSIYRDGKPLLLGFISSEKPVGLIREYAQRKAHNYKDMFDKASCFGYSTSSADKLVIQFFESDGEKATELGIPTALGICTTLDYLKDYEEITKIFRNTTQKETGKEKE